ncbi:MAG: TlpA family protein disulfide reductase [Candidatus Heimdallarchaeota archaeon]|nr:TlpA family protein disulfide reductase [Candidatus Heimdallarchaeota archaeon]
MSQRRRRNHKLAISQTNDDIDQVIKKIDRVRVKTQKRDNEILKVKPKSFNRIYVIIPVFLLVLAIPMIYFADNVNTSQPSDPDSDVSGRYIFQDLSGSTLDLIQFKGKHIILDYMGTYCIPCKQQVEILKDFVIDSPNIVVVSFSEESTDELNNFVTINNISWIVLHDKYHMSVKLRITHMPTLVHFTPEFVEGHRNIGVTSYEMLISWVE